MDQSLARKLARQFRAQDFVFLMWLEKFLLRRQSTSDCIEMPLVAIVGPPRVGSTLMYQILAAATECFYFDNLQNAFSHYPYLGFLLSDSFGKKSTGKLKSDHGFVEGAGGMSEGNIFWPFWFDMQLQEKTPQTFDSRLRHMQQALTKIHERNGLPLVSSYNAHAFYLFDLAKHFPKLVIINMRREPVANAVSILRGRHEIEGGSDNWWSIRPAQCLESRYPDPYSQIFCQIIEIYKTVKQQRSLIPHVPVVDVNYSDLCENPDGVVDEILSRCETAGVNLSLRNNAPPIPRLTESGPRPGETAAAENFQALFEMVDWDDLWS